MLTYEEVKTNPRKFLSLTSLTPDEFEDLLPAFEKANLKKYPASKTMTGKARKRKAGAGRTGSLASIEQKLLFGLVYQKGYPLQSIMGELFGISQGRACRSWGRASQAGSATRTISTPCSRVWRDGRLYAVCWRDSNRRRRFCCWAGESRCRCQ